MDRTKIEWTDATWNPITGCSVISPGCTNCYAMRMAGTRLKNHPSRKGLTRPTSRGPVWTGEVRLNEKELLTPLKWKKPRMIFVCAHGDLFHEDVPFTWIMNVYAVMERCPQHTFQVLTKRPDRMRELLTTEIFYGLRQKWPLPNVWVGISAEDQDSLNKRTGEFLRTPAVKHFISFEPLLEYIEAFSMDGPMDVYGPKGAPIDWMIVGGESGPGARPMKPEWARALRDQAVEAGVPFFFKQWGEWGPCEDGEADPWDWDPPAEEAFGGPAITADPVWRVGKKIAGRRLDGKIWDEMPC